MNGRFRTGVVLVCALAALIAPLDAHARHRGGASPYDRAGFYLGAGYRTDQVEGGFDGESFLTNGDMLALVPKVESGGGPEFSLYALGTYGGLAASYSEESHDASYRVEDVTVPLKSHLNEFSLDFRITPFPRLPIQPHAVLGMGFKRLSVDDAALDVVFNKTGDAVYRGISWDAGAGASVLVAQRLLLDFSAVHCSSSYNTIAVGGEGSTITISDGLKGPGWSLRGAVMLRLTRW